VPGLPLKIDLDFSIDLVLGAIPTSKVSYWMRTPDLVELKVQLKVMLDKGYIRSSVSPWGASTMFVNKKDGMFHLCIEYRCWITERGGESVVRNFITFKHTILFKNIHYFIMTIQYIISSIIIDNIMSQ
jgi:hypothetical protein